MNLVDLTVREFIAELGSPVDGPGGGSASALLGLAGIALLKMATGRSKVCSFDSRDLAELDDQLSFLIDEDTRAFAAVVALQSQPQANDPLPNDPLEQAVIHAIEIPLAIVRICCAGLKIAQQSIVEVDRSMLSEILVASEALQAGGNSSLVNMKVNLTLLKNAETIADFMRLIEQYRAQLTQLRSAIYQQVNSQMLD